VRKYTPEEFIEKAEREFREAEEMDQLLEDDEEPE
jgi:hypothetical protein